MRKLWFLFFAVLFAAVFAVCFAGNIEDDENNSTKNKKCCCYFCSIYGAVRNFSRRKLNYLKHLQTKFAAKLKKCLRNERV